MYELALGLGGVALTFAIVMVAVKVLRFLPVSLADKVVDPHHSKYNYFFILLLKKPTSMSAFLCLLLSPIYFIFYYLHQAIDYESSFYFSRA
jgi:hypothetical protein